MWEGVELLCPVWAHPSPSTSLCSPTWKFFEPQSFEMLWPLHHVGMIDELHFLAFSLLKRMRGEAKDSRLLVMVFLVPGPQPAAIRSCPVTSLEPQTLLSPRKLQGFSSLSGIEVKDQY